MTADIPDLESTDGYRRFIRAALRYADSVGVCYTSDFSAFKESEWQDELGESVIGHGYDEYGGLELLLKTDYAVYNWLMSKKSVFDFGDFGDDEFLWDLCLYRENREIFGSVTHEREYYISDELCAYIKESK